VNRRVAEQFWVLLVSIVFSRGNTEGSLRQRRGDVKMQRRDYFSAKRCNEVFPSVAVGDKTNSGEIGVERKSFGADRKCTHTNFNE
jgi:hypothetical protein